MEAAKMLREAKKTPEEIEEKIGTPCGAGYNEVAKLVLSKMEAENAERMRWASA